MIRFTDYNNVKKIEIGKEIKLSLPIFFIHFVEKEKNVEKN